MVPGLPSAATPTPRTTRSRATPLRRDPRLTETLGETAYFLGRNDAALRNFQNYVGAVPEGGRVGMAYYYMGEIYLRLGRFGHADIAFSTALQFTPGSAKWWTRLGYAREKLRRRRPRPRGLQEGPLP